MGELRAVSISAFGRPARRLGEPSTVLGFRYYFKFSVHLIVAHAAELRACDVIDARSYGSDIYPDRLPWHRILLDSQCGHEKAVNDILGLQIQRQRIVFRQN